MATIRKLPSGSWNAIIRKKGLPTQTKTCDTREELEAWVSKIESCTEASKRNTIEANTERYLNEVMEISGKERGGHRTAKYLLNLLSTHFSQDVRKITSLDVEDYKVLRLKTCKSGTVRLELQMLKRFLEWGELKGIIKIDRTKDIFRNIKLPRASPNRNEVINPNDFERLLQVLKPEMQCICILAYETAMRRSEIIQITPKMVDFEKRIILLSSEQTKNRSGREVPLSTRAQDTLISICSDRDKNSLLFNYKKNSITQAFKRAVVKLQLSDELCFHSLRHTCITRYAEKGLSNMQLKAISGHKTVQMLSRYCHLDGEDVVEFMD